MTDAEQVRHEVKKRRIGALQMFFLIGSVAGCVAVVVASWLVYVHGSDQEQQVQDAKARTHMDAVAAVSAAYRQCNSSNESRADLRDQRDSIAELLDEFGAHTRATEYRQKHAGDFPNQDCDARRIQDLRERGLPADTPT